MGADTGSKKDKKKKGKAKAEEAEQDAASDQDLILRCQELEAKALRAHADYQNLKRRAQADLEAGLRRQMTPLLDDLLLVLDFLDMALASPATHEETKNLAMGVEMTRNKFVQALEASDVVAIDTTGKFDPTLHDAAEAIDDPDQEPGTILATLRRGYKWQEQVLRPAQVRVVAGDLKTNDEAADEGTDEADAEASTQDEAEE